MKTLVRKGLMMVGIVVGLLVLVILAVWGGMQIKPRAFDDYGDRTPALEKVPVPDDLPEPVARFYDVITGGTNEVPVIDSAVLTGRATMRLNGISFQARFRFTHEAGQNYRHYIEGTTWSLPLLKVNERYLDGVSRMELPFGSVEDNSNVNQAANLGLWGEAIWFPSLFVTDPRVRWEAVDQHTARLIVPFEDGEDSFTVNFNADTGLIDTMVAMRYKGEESTEKTAWALETSQWSMQHGIMIPSLGVVQWGDEDQPWAEFTVEDVAYNVDVSDYLRQKGL